MRQKLTTMFITSAGILLVLTATAKLVSSFGSAPVQQDLDPLFHIQFKYLLWSVSLIEFAVAAICTFGDSQKIQAGLIGLLAIQFVLYRLGLLLVGYGKICPCLGHLSEGLPISPEAADMGLKAILAYWLIGSCSALFVLCSTGRASAPKS